MEAKVPSLTRDAYTIYRQVWQEQNKEAVPAWEALPPGARMAWVAAVATVVGACLYVVPEEE
jgi:hypothetical protein